jgi:hypothetical protein
LCISALTGICCLTTQVSEGQFFIPSPELGISALTGICCLTTMNTTYEVRLRLSISALTGICCLTTSAGNVVVWGNPGISALTGICCLTTIQAVRVYAKRRGYQCPDGHLLFNYTA